MLFRTIFRGGAQQMPMKNDAQEHPPVSIDYPIRLNRYLAACGLGARRKVEQLISDGRVMIDGVTESTLGRVLTEPCRVTVDGREISFSPHLYLVMNKPTGVLSAVEDKRERTVLDLLPERYRKLRPFPVGRLDKDSEGLLILTNDGDCAQQIIHPSAEIPRTYEVLIYPSLDAKQVAEWRTGVNIMGRRFTPLAVEALDGNRRCFFRVVLREGIKREVRLMVKSFGSRVQSLRRVALGGLLLRDIPIGGFLEFSRDQLWNEILKEKA